MFKLAGPKERPPNGTVRVQVFLSATAEVDLFMPKAIADAVDESDPMFIDDVLDAAGDDLVNLLDFEISDLHVCEPKTKDHAK